MYGKDTKDILYRVGGFGRFIGDEGSGYAIGKKGLMAVSRHFDGRGIPTLLSNLLEKEHKITTPEDLIIKIYKQHFDIASFAPVVFKAAEQGDAVAKKIIDEEAAELVSHIVAMQKKILVRSLEVAFIGSVITTQNIFSGTVRKLIAEKVPGVEIKEAKHSPAFGACLLAMKKV